MQMPESETLVSRPKPKHHKCEKRIKEKKKREKKKKYEYKKPKIIEHGGRETAKSVQGR